MTKVTQYSCDSCDWKGTLEDLDTLEAVSERVLVGELMAAGQCPGCGELISVADADVPDNTIENVAAIMRSRGWSVRRPPTRKDKKVSSERK